MGEMMTKARKVKARCYSLNGTTQTQHDALLWYRAAATGVREPRDVVELLTVEGWAWCDVHPSWRGPLRRWRSLRHADRIRIAERFMWHRFSEHAVPMENR